MLYFLVRALGVLSFLWMPLCGQEVPNDKQVEALTQASNKQSTQTSLQNKLVDMPSATPSSINVATGAIPSNKIPTEEQAKKIAEQKTTVNSVDAATQFSTSNTPVTPPVKSEEPSGESASKIDVSLVHSPAQEKAVTENSPVLAQVAASAPNVAAQAAVQSPASGSVTEEPSTPNAQSPTVEHTQEPTAAAPAPVTSPEQQTPSQEPAQSAPKTSEQVHIVVPAQPQVQQDIQASAQQPENVPVESAENSKEFTSSPEAAESPAQTSEQPTVQAQKEENTQATQASPAVNPTETQKIVASDQPSLEPEGIDTLDVQGGGNWLLKRGWWEQAERKYEKTKALLDKILEARMPFLDKRAEVDRTVFDPFYSQIGLDQGRLEETLSFLNDEVNQEREKEGTLKEEERALLNNLVAQKKTLEQLTLDVQTINKLDHQIDAVISKLMEQINRARGYEQQSWKAFKDIARELSDEKARELAGAMDTHFANMEALYHYVTADLGQFYVKLIEDSLQQVENVKGQMQALKEKGIDLKNQAERIARQDMEADKEKSEEEKQEEIKKALEKQKAEQKGFFGTAWAYVTGFFSAIASFFGGIVSWVMGLFSKK